MISEPFTGFDLFARWILYVLFPSCAQGLQSFLYGMLRDSSIVASKMSLEVMVTLYKKNIWLVVT
jgi:hypothetical protein